MDKGYDHQPVLLISEPTSLASSTATGINVNYGTLQMSGLSDLPKDLRKRGRTQPRSVSKNGHANVSFRNIGSPREKKFVGDLFTSLLEAKWGWTLFIFCFSYFGSWTLFAFGWYGILYFHDDLQHADNDETWKPCITGIHTFAGWLSGSVLVFHQEYPGSIPAFLFSVETQHTTGYGFYHLSDECPEAIILMCLQSIVSVILEGLMVGLVFIKMSRAKKRTATIIFRNAIINQRDGQLCFMFRVADLRTKSKLLDAQVRALLIRKRSTLEGEVVNFYQEELKVHGDSEKDGRILLLWPTTVVHKIDSSSPLFEVSPSDLTVHNDSFEIIVVLEGIVESTGLTVQARSSYLPSEIFWGHRFESLDSSAKTGSWGQRIIDYTRFHSTYPITTTTLSAAELTNKQ